MKEEEEEEEEEEEKRYHYDITDIYCLPCPRYTHCTICPPYPGILGKM
jgi:hypothetical protein